ncbi:hypothetical protein FRACYDRAFT_244133 [Fragilariopsis cylindrus CCMP1102]|uniref:Uncharacterized protein n=1 Tax=Fragilariopsis cylindrus CCMP1102 TaxID=635003 RepID=A0A1E7F3W7_9STRA|nr:hypothetical protein FRACYDRAFT_244133 [Fragilariopsis cylindrus CCMP1102]|eukprot:OEU12860.1 hypothetical protein FRACYDRAFT_244133 [Fragilariopsis cylindrus CCMP1102]
MCLPRTNTNTSTPLTHISNNIMIKHRLMKAKMFASQVQSQSQAQQQLLSSTMKMINNDNTNSDTDTDVSRCVRFNNDVIVVPFEKVTIQENKETPNNIWYTTTEMKQIKKESREIASSYRKLGGNGDTDTATEYRGFENCTAIRQKQKIMSNRCVVYAYEQGFNANEIATIYSKTNKWSSEVAFLQAIHDYMNVYDCASQLRTQSETIALPSISSMIPPQPHPFAIESVMVMQRKKKRQRAAQAQAQQLFASPTHTQERSVRQRVC